ncbi:hypothetical protein [Chryseobacterium taklimakanense]
MNKFYNETLHKLETAINELEIETDCSIQRIEAVIHLILECLCKLKEYVLKRGFRNTDEEIRFFKYQKPAFVAKLIYYNAIYNRNEETLWSKAHKKIPQQRTEKT